VKPLHLGWLDAAGQCHGREARPVQNLIGIGVAYPTEEPRVGEGPFESVIFGSQAPRKGRWCGDEGLEAAAVELLERLGPLHQVQRGPSGSAGLGEQQGAMGKVKGGEAQSFGHRRLCSLPLEPARDHQVQDEEEAAVELDDDPLAEPGETYDPAAGNVADGRLHRPEQERAREAPRDRPRYRAAPAQGSPFRCGVGEKRSGRLREEPPASLPQGNAQVISRKAKW